MPQSYLLHKDVDSLYSGSIVLFYIELTLNEYSIDADLTLIGFHEDILKVENSTEMFEGYNIGNILFVNTLKGKFIK